MPLLRPWRQTTILFLAVLLFPTPVHAEEVPATTLTEEQKTEKRLLFNQFVEMQLAAARRKKYEQASAQTLKRTFISRMSASYGYDGNVNLDSSHRGDGYTLLSGEGAFEAEFSALGILPPRKVGVSWYTELMAYDNFETSNYQSSTLSLYTEERLRPELSLKGQYDINYVRYFNNNQVSYVGHKLKPTLTHYASQHFSHNAFGSYELRKFEQRQALSATASPLPLYRQDDRYELGWGARYYPDDKTFAGATTALQWNDSNDIFHDYNDYSGWKINGFIYRKLPDRFSTVGFAGYDRKEYDRTFIGGEQKDGFFYLGGYLYYDFTKNWQAFVSYLYKQNDSNDPAMEYSGYNTSAGVNLTF